MCDVVSSCHPGQVIMACAGHFIELFWRLSQIVQLFSQAKRDNFVPVAMYDQFRTAYACDLGCGIKVDSCDGLQKPNRKDGLRHVPGRGEWGLQDQPCYRRSRG